MNQFQRINSLVAMLVGAALLLLGSVAYAASLAEADKLFRQGRHEQALEKTNSFLAENPKDAQGRFLKGLILTVQEKVADAIGIFQGLTVDFPELPEPYNNLAVLYASQGKYDLAKSSLEMAIRTHPSYSTAHENLGDIYAKMASQAYDRALQLDRSNAATQTKLAMIQDLFEGNKQKSAESSPPEKAPAKPKDIPPAKQQDEAPVVIAASTPIPQPKPKPKPQQEKPAEKAALNNDIPPTSIKEILETVDAWAAAWSAQNVDDYLSYYADDFRPNKGQSIAAWKNLRRERVSFPESIQVSVGKPTVKFVDNDHATVRFRQSYRASHMNATGNKTLMMSKSDGKWLIQEEQSR